MEKEGRTALELASPARYVKTLFELGTASGFWSDW